MDSETTVRDAPPAGCLPATPHTALVHSQAPAATDPSVGPRGKSEVGCSRSSPAALTTAAPASAAAGHRGSNACTHAWSGPKVWITIDGNHDRAGRLTATWTNPGRTRVHRTPPRRRPAGRGPRGEDQHRPLREVTPERTDTEVAWATAARILHPETASAVSLDRMTASRSPARVRRLDRSSCRTEFWVWTTV